VTPINTDLTSSILKIKGGAIMNEKDFIKVKNEFDNLFYVNKNEITAVFTSSKTGLTVIELSSGRTINTTELLEVILLLLAE